MEVGRKIMNFHGELDIPITYSYDIVYAPGMALQKSNQGSFTGSNAEKHHIPPPPSFEV